MMLPSSGINHIALDWVGQRLYLTNLESSRITISVVSLDSLMPPREILRMFVTGVNMVDVTLSPYAGYVIYEISCDLDCGLVENLLFKFQVLALLFF